MNNAFSVWYGKDVHTIFTNRSDRDEFMEELVASYPAGFTDTAEYRKWTCRDGRMTYSALGVSIRWED